MDSFDADFDFASRHTRYIHIIYQSVKERVATTFCQCLRRRGLSFSLTIFFNLFLLNNFDLQLARKTVFIQNGADFSAMLKDVVTWLTHSHSLLVLIQICTILYGNSFAGKLKVEIIEQKKIEENGEG